MRKHYIHITSPPDARYSPLEVSARDKGRPVYTEVRALVVPVIPDRSGNRIVVLPQVPSELVKVFLATNMSCIALHSFSLPIELHPCCKVRILLAYIGS